MRAAILHQYNQTPKVEDVDVQEPLEGEVLVHIAASGICGSDIHFSHGIPGLGDHLPIVLGHEGAGVVEAVGRGVTDLQRGDRVIVAMNAPCGHCDYCGEGRMHFCNGNPRGATFGEMNDGTYRLSQQGRAVHSFVGVGSFGEYAVVRRGKLVQLDFEAPLESMCVIPCGVTTGLGAVFNVSDLKPGSTALVFGCGGVGLSIVQGARIAGAATIIAVDTNSRKLDMAANLGATHCLPSPADPKELIAEVKKIVPRGVEVAFDAVGGAPERLQHLMASTDLGGMTVAVGVLGWTDDVPVKGVDLLYGARRLVGVRGGNSSPGVDLKRTLNLYRTGRLKLDEMVGETFGLDQFDQAWAAAAKADHARTIVKVTPSLL
jgi:S-(hydroxymethyl)glutathione dehydrogenase/alcohol dehydrogenase